MSKQFIIGFVTASVVMGPLSLAAQPPAEQEKWVSLFNGRDLSGWKVKIKGYELGDNFGNTFRVVDWALDGLLRQVRQLRRKVRTYLL